MLNADQPGYDRRLIILKSRRVIDNTAHPGIIGMNFSPYNALRNMLENILPFLDLTMFYEKFDRIVTRVFTCCHMYQI